MMRVIEGGLVYRNSKSHLCSRHAWHPSIVPLPNGELLAAFDLGEAVESLDYATYVTRSRDGGEKWSTPERLSFDPWLDQADEGVPCSHSIRISAVRGGQIVGVGARWRRKDPQEGLINRRNLGMVAMDLFLVRSRLNGWTWSPPEPISPPLLGPAFELCHPVRELQDGRWLLPTSTWKGWDGSCPNGMQAVALVSRDQGTTWPETLSIANEYNRGVICWEVGLTELADGRLAAALWRFDERQGKSLSSRYTISQENGTFSPLRENGLRGETAKLTALADGRVLCVYRRLDTPGLWAELLHFEGSDWKRQQELPLWQGAKSGVFGRSNAGDELGTLRFGYPSAVQLPGGDVLILFWCVEECLHVIRWQRLRID